MKTRLGDRGRLLARTLPAALGLLGVHALLANTSIANKGFTYDESGHLMRGLAFWRHPDNRLILHQPPLAPAWAVIPLLDDDLRLPSLEQEAWHRCHTYAMADQLLFRLGNDPDVILRTARRMIIVISLATGVVVFLWSAILFGPAGGLISLTLYAFSPTVLAHGSLATTDAMVTFFFLLSVAALWWLLHRAGWLSLVSCCLALSGLFLSKLSAVIIVPVGVILTIIRLAVGSPLEIRLGLRRRIRSRWSLIAVFAGLLPCLVAGAGLAIWAAYGFRYPAILDPVSGVDALPPLQADAVSDRVLALFSRLRDSRVLPEAYLYEILYVMQGVKGNDAFLDGHRSVTGWWYFFPACFLYKVPLPIMGVILLSVVAAAGRTRWGACDTESRAGRRPRAGVYGAVPLFVLIVVYWPVVMNSHLNIGHRHLLPTFPPMFILCGVSCWWLRSRGWWTRLLPVGCLICLVAVSLRAWPDYLAFFNSIAGGSKNGYRHLVDSSLDWGQDLPGLKRWLDEAKVRREGGGSESEADHVYLSYMGTDDPDYRGIDARMLPSSVERPWQPEREYTFEGGVYCISATTLQQVYLLPESAWTAEFEDRYEEARDRLERYRRSDQLENEAAGSGRAQESTLVRSLESARGRTWREYERFAFGRLCAFLRQREPDAQVGYTINIYRLTEDEVQRSLQSPPADLFAGWERRTERPDR